MCGADQSASHENLIPSQWSGPSAGRSQSQSSLWPDMAARPRRSGGAGTLRHACRNTDRVRGKKRKLKHILGQHGVDVSLSEIFLKPGQAFRLANYVCHRTDRLTAGGGTAMLVRRVIQHHSVPVPRLAQLKASAIQTRGEAPP